MAAQQTATSEGDFSSAFARIQGARKTQHNYMKKDQDIDDEVKELQQRLQGLEMRRKLNGGQHNEWLSGTSIIPYAKAWNLKYAEMIQINLPRELRDMVYDYLWDRDTRHASFELHAIMRGEFCPDQAHLLHLCDHHGLPHFLSPNYVGPQAALEVAEALYKTDSAEMINVQSPKQLDRVLTRDSFMVGLQPATVLRNLDLWCKLDDYRTPKLSHSQSSKCKHATSDANYIEATRLTADINTLFQVKDKKNFYLSIEFLQRNVRLAVLAEVLETIRHVRNAFVTAGGEVNFTWEYCSNSDAGYPVIWNVNNYFDIPRSEWEFVMRKHLEAHKDAILSKHYRIDDEPDLSLDTNTFVHGMWCDSESEFSSEDGSSSDSDEDESNGSNEDSDMDL